jgi:hypothetical protein
MPDVSVLAPLEEQRRASAVLVGDSTVPQPFERSWIH